MSSKELSNYKNDSNSFIIINAKMTQKSNKNKMKYNTG